MEKLCMEVNLIKKNYSFDSKKYIKDDIKVNKGFKIVKLGDICELLSTTKHNTSEGLNEGKYRFYS